MMNGPIKKAVAVFLSVLMLMTLCVAGVSAQSDSAVGGTCDDGAHVYGYMPVEVIDATCNTPRVLVYKCKNCAETEIRYEGKADSGAHNMIIMNTVEPTCTEDGVLYYYCTFCSEVVDQKPIAATGHADADENNVCDVFGCNTYLGTEPPEEKCECMCHSDDTIKQLLYKFLSFFWKLFKIEQECECGELHY